MGFEVVNFRSFSKVELQDGKIADINTIYTPITKIVDGAIVPSVALILTERVFIFNPDTNELEEHDIVDEGLEINRVLTEQTMTIEKNTYVRMYAFDCTKETDQQDSSYQPISGLLTSSSYLTIKTHNFTSAKDEPKHEDILAYQGRFWLIEDTSKSYIYTPKEKSVLHLTLKALK